MVTVGEFHRECVRVWEAEEDEDWEEVWNRLDALASQDHAFEALTEMGLFPPEPPPLPVLK